MSPLRRALAGGIAWALVAAPMAALAEPTAVIAPPAGNAGTVTSVACPSGTITASGTCNPLASNATSGDVIIGAGTEVPGDSGTLLSSLQSIRVEIGSLHNANMNSTADQAITLTCPAAVAQCVVTQFIFWGCTGTPSSAQGAFYTGASKSGYTFFGGAATSPLGAIGAGTLAAVGESSQPMAANGAKSLEVVSGSPVSIYFSLTTAQGSSMTCNIAVMADIIT